MRRIDELHLEYPFAGSRMIGGLEDSAESGVTFCIAVPRRAERALRATVASLSRKLML